MKVPWRARASRWRRHWGWQVSVLRVLRRNGRALLVSATAAMSTAVLDGQSEKTLRELAFEYGSIGQATVGCGGLPALSDHIKRADLIVEGVVIRRFSHLTVDERSVFTDYELAISDVLYQRRVVAMPRPGLAPPPIVFKTPGGHVSIDGHDIDVDVRSNNARVTRKEGDHAFLCARLDPKDGKWRFDAFDVFVVKGIDVVPPDQFSDVGRSISPAELRKRVAESPNR